MFVAKKATFSENSGITYLDHLILMLPTTNKGIGDAGHVLQKITTNPRYPTNRAMPSMQN